ncbi:Pre-miRNA 5'-monophosphate methyltransferase like protein [Argiope bruennichi]|uniref:RNA methyltransferase n=1 Tax=Argiope bruennichi TaxID=94029 RepID=A0A8T0E6V6_ARGBR|nr:Pre-miRNA 5'-monophosphate methyltransferase like protein [Argiope bruennichi]
MDCDVNSRNDNPSKESFEPGAARFGNFINYYTFNSVSKRLQKIPSNLVLSFQKETVLCLDIGCNSGELTQGLYSHLTKNLDTSLEVYILGIDLDETLITRCKESNNYEGHITYQQMDIMSNTSVSQLESFLQKYNRTEFDLITCFSTTMWIHLNHGDNGLDNFLSTISKLGKYLLLEPQEWKSYKSALRRMTRLNREAFALEKLKTRDITNHLLQFLPQHGKNVYQCFGETSWGRSLFLFQDSS